MSDWVVGVDAGFTGAVAAFYNGKIADVHDMPTLPVKAGRNEINHHALLAIMQRYAGSAVWLEAISARPGQGVTSMFRFGQGYGAIEMACAAAGCSVAYVSPAKWKRHFGLIGTDKDAARSLAIQRVPALASMLSRKKDIGRADAILIALYGAGHW
jgi:crossover junction endodeoxyribonuclease RuvC